MRYDDKGFGYELNYELTDDIVLIQSRSFSATASRQIDVRTLSSNITRQKQRSQRIKNRLLIASVIGILVITVGGLLLADRLLGFSPCLIFSLVAVCLI